MSVDVQGLSRTQSQTFSIIEEFALLNPRRKVALYDRLFKQGSHAFQGAVRAVWPEAEDSDVKKLENFLYLLKKTVH